MNWSDEKLGDLLRSLPSAPEHLVERVKGLPSHLGGEVADGLDDDDFADPDAGLDAHPVPPADHDLYPPDDLYLPDELPDDGSLDGGEDL